MVKVMDEWLELSLGGRVHLVLEYDPVGMEPQVDDIVYFEGRSVHYSYYYYYYYHCYHYYHYYYYYYYYYHHHRCDNPNYYY